MGRTTRVQSEKRLWEALHGSPSFLVLLSFAMRMASSQMGGGAGGALSPQLWNDETRAVELNFTSVLRISLAESGRALVD